MRLEHPYDGWGGGTLLRGQLHTHSTRSDGRLPPQAVIDAYAGLGHGFLMFSDHDVFTGAEEYGAWDDRGLVLLPGNEVTSHGPHLLHVGADRRVEPHADRQRVLDEIRAGAGFAIMNHPNWQEHFGHCPQEELERLQGYAGIEIYNGTIGRLAGSPYATDRWDRLLSRGRRAWGYANDDHHLQGEAGMGWNVVDVPVRSEAAILHALRGGRFYASTGVTIRAIAVDGTRVTVETEDAERVVAHTDHGRRIAVADGRSLSVDAGDAKTYVRFACWGRGERFAWTQPFWIVRD